MAQFCWPLTAAVLLNTFVLSRTLSVSGSAGPIEVPDGCSRECRDNKIGFLHDEPNAQIIH